MCIKNILIFTMILFIGVFTPYENLYAACTGTTYTWDGSSSDSWNTGANWDLGTVPNASTHDVVINSGTNNLRFDTNATVGCLILNSGTATNVNSRTITVTGDELTAASNTLSLTGSNFRFTMAGTSNQEVDIVDDIRDFYITNTNTVTLKNSFRINRETSFPSSGTLSIEALTRLNRTGATHTIPAGYTVVVKNGGEFFVRGDLIVNGTLKIEGGGILRMYRLKTLTVGSGGILELDGSSGNPATITSEAGNRDFNFNLNGTLIANYFTIQGPSAAGMNVSTSATISQMDNGNFRDVMDTGYLITLAGTPTVPATWDTIGFYNDDAVATPGNIDAGTYTGSAFSIDDYAGDIAGTTYDNDTNSKITWNAPAATELSLTNDAETGEPGAYTDPSDSFTFAEFKFTLTQSDTATDITSVTFTMIGTGSISDFSSIRAWVDANGNCNFNSGSDTDLGELSFSGSPPEATVAITPGDLSTSGPSDPACIMIRATASADPVDQKTLQFSIVSTDDVTNSQGYAFATTASPQVDGGISTVRNPNYSTWAGSTDTAWSDTNNWTGGLPTSTRTCYVGTGTNTATVDTTPITCSNATLQPSGELDWNSTANVFEVSGGLTVDSTFTFSNASSGQITMNGTTNQDIDLGTSFPGNFVINNSGTTFQDVTFSSSATIAGNLTCTDGVMVVPDGITVTVQGDLTIQSGCEVEIEPGGDLKIGNNSTLTVNTGGTLTVVGSAAKVATIEAENSSSSFDIQVDGNIAARYYAIKYLNANGMTISSSATIDVTNYLQDGSFTEPTANSTTFLNLGLQIPGNALSDMNFDSSSTGHTGLINIDTTGAAAGTLNITAYSGDVAGPANDTDPTYTISWSGATTTLDVMVEENPESATLTSGNTYKMGRISLVQHDAGASYSDTDIQSIKVRLSGSATANDIDEVRLVKDTDCDGTNGSLLYTQTFSGSPATTTFNLAASELIVAADVATPVKNCFYIEYKIASDATDGNTAGFEITSAIDITDSQGYGISSSTPAPFTPTVATIDTPSTTTWLGTTDSDWTDTSNWSAGLPTSTKSCTINASGNNPVISSGTQACKNLLINGGSLTINASTTLEVYGNIDNSATLTINGDLDIADGGSSLEHTISSSSTISKLDITKTGGGFVQLATNDVTITTLTLSGSDFDFNITNGRTLTLPNGVTIPDGKVSIDAGGKILIGNGQSISVTGGEFETNGSNDAFPQVESTKAQISVQGGSGSYGFSATSGTVHLFGFCFDRLDNNGINLSGTTNLTALDGGQFTNLSASYASMNAIQLNNSGGLPATATNIAWTWGDFNSFDPATANTPTSSDGYTLVSSTGCNSDTIDFTGWTGDFYETETTFDVSTKVSASSCTVNLAASASSVQLLSFEATPYNGEVAISWETNLEKNHLGFNVYRADINGENFIQMNSTLMRNLTNYVNKKGKYRFIDNDVTNGETYYYYIEDIDLSGTASLHGPVNATPDAALGSAPVVADTNEDNNADDAQDGGSASDGTIANPSYKDLGNGVIIRHQTSTNIQIEITPGNPSFGISAWDGNYEDINLDGYSLTTDENKPALPIRVLLIEVDEFVESASLIDSNINGTTDYTSYTISPAPSYALNGSDILVPSYNPDATLYATDDYTQSDYFNIQSSIVTNGSRKYLKIELMPIKHNPVQEKLTRADEITLNIGLDVSSWEVDPPNNLALESVANLLRIDFNKSGMYELEYDDFVNNYLEYPFKDLPVAEFRMYLNGDEIPLEIDSADADFNTGDKIRFYLSYSASQEDNKNTAFLSPTSLDSSEGNELRIQSLDSDPTEMPAIDDNVFLQNIVLEQNDEFVDGDTLGDNEDHFIWASLFNFAGFDRIDVDVDLEGLASDYEEEISIKVHLIGMKGFFGNQNPHDLELYIDSNLVDNIEFEENGRQIITFDVNPSYFNGTTNIELRVPGTYAYSGDYDRIIIDKIEIDYYSDQPISDYLNIDTIESELAQTIYGFSSNSVNIYDVTDTNDVSKLSNVNIFTEDAGTTYNLEFYADENTNSEGFKKYIALIDTEYLTPIGLSLNAGGEVNLKASSNKYEYLIIGDKTLLGAAYNLVLHREDQGLNTLSVSLQDIYDQFGHGTVSNQAIQDFINYALDNWKQKPKYVLILGDGTNDPLNYDTYGLGSTDNASIEDETIAIPLLAGSVIDFGSDNYYAQKNSYLPRLSIGRLPTNNFVDIENYIQKVIDFENGDALPSNTKQYQFIAGKELGYYEEFREKTDLMASAATKFNQRGFSSSVLDHSDFGSDAAYITEVENIMADPPLFVNYMGHGAANLWGSATFDETDASALTNEKYPIVLSWNCENAFFYDPDKTIVSLAESFIFNEKGGSVIFLGSTTQTTPTAQARLALAFYQTMATETKSWDKGQRIGDILYKAKYKVGNGAYEKDIINSFTIIGDPALKIPKELYADKPSSSGGGGGGGCSAGASDGEFKRSWYEFFFEIFSIVFFVLLLNLMERKFIRRKD